MSRFDLFATLSKELLTLVKPSFHFKGADKHDIKIGYTQSTENYAHVVSVAFSSATKSNVQAAKIC